MNKARVVALVLDYETRAAHAGREGAEAVLWLRDLRSELEDLPDDPPPVAAETVAIVREIAANHEEQLARAIKADRCDETTPAQLNKRIQALRRVLEAVGGEP